MCENQNYIDGELGLTSIEIGKGEEVAIEVLLMKLATVQDLIRLHNMAEDEAEVAYERAEPLDNWTVAAIYKNLFDVSHALKCACWGYKEAYGK
jgi:hypothetical protein